MQHSICAAVAAVLLLPAVGAAQQTAYGDDVDEVVVVGRSVSTGVSRTEINREMLIDTATALKDMPGANVNSNGALTGIAQYRGMYGDRVAVVIDHLGIVSGGPNAMDAPLSYVSPMITGELTVTRGIPGVSLAPEAIGGHIAAELARGEFAPQAMDLSGFVGSRYSANGNLATSAARLTLAGVNHKLTMLAEVDDGDDVATPVGMIRPSRFHRERSDLSYAFTGDRASLLLFAGRLDTDDTGTPALPMDIRFITTDLAGMQAGFAVSDGVSLSARVAWNDVEHLMDNFGLRAAPDPMRQRENFTTGRGGQLRLGGTFALPASTLEVGIDATQADHDATITNPNNGLFRIANFNDVSRDVRSAFVEWRGDVANGEIELGLRGSRVAAKAGIVSASGIMGDMGSRVEELADAFNAADRSPSWNTVDALARYRHFDKSGTEWRLEIGQKSRAPSYQELFLWLPMQATGGLADGRSYIGDLALDAEQSREVVVGLGRNFGRVTLSPQIFYRRVDGYIQGVVSTNMPANMVSMMMSGLPALQFANVDAEIWGGDIAWRVGLSDNWYLDGIASYVRGQRRDADDDLYRLAPPNATVGLTWHNDAMKVTTEVVGYARQDDVSLYNGEQGTPGYGLVNAMFEWSPGNRLRLEARVDNLLDRAYQDHVAGVNRAGGSDVPVGVRLYGVEPTLAMGFAYSF
jgi:iron complex outermembrane recepter protein